MMVHKFFVPIYEYGEPNIEHGTKFGTNMYCDLQELYAYEDEAIGHFEVTGTIDKPKSGAV